MKTYPTNPFFYWDETRAAAVVPVRGRRRDYTRRACELVAEIKDRYARGRTGGVRGFENLQNMFEMFNRLNRLSLHKYNEPVPPMHTSLFKTLVSAALPRMFGANYDFYKKQLMLEFGMDVQRLKTAASMPRRFGKTTVAAWFVGSYTWSQYHGEQIGVVVVSMNRDVSKLLTEAIVNTIIELSDGAVNFNVKNDSRIEFVNSAGDPVIIHSRICTNVSFIFIFFILVWPICFEFLLLL